MPIKLKGSRQPGYTVAGLISDEIVVGRKMAEAAATSRFYRDLRVNRVINRVIRDCSETLGGARNWKNGCLYREKGLPNQWNRSRDGRVVCDHAIPVTELVHRYWSGEPLELLVLSPVARISVEADQALDQSGCRKAGHRDGLPLYRYTHADIPIVTHEDKEVDTENWTDADHWRLVSRTQDLEPVLVALDIIISPEGRVSRTPNKKFSQRSVFSSN